MTPVPPAVRLEVEERAQGLCEARLPGCHGVWHVLHHKLPRSAGGAHSADNLMAVCGFDGVSEGCHQRIHSHPTESYERGFLVRRSA